MDKSPKRSPKPKSKKDNVKKMQTEIKTASEMPQGKTAENMKKKSAK